MKLSLIFPADIDFYTQGFGENRAYYADPKFGGIKGHNGLDFPTQHGVPIYATHDGVARYEVDRGGGQGVVITSNDMFEDVNGRSSRWKTIYWHLCDPIKEPQFKSPIEGGTKFVKQGELIGYSDNTGYSTGDHLHFVLKPLDSLGNNLEQNNGYLGAVDPNLYFNGIMPRNLEKEIEKLKLKVGLLQKLIEIFLKIRNFGK